MTRLADLLAAAVAGSPPAPDGAVETVPAPLGVQAAIVAFTGHHVVAADVDPAWVAERCRPWELDAPFGPAFVSALAERLGAHAGTLDLVLAGIGVAPADPWPSGVPPLDLRPATPAEAAGALVESPHVRGDARVWATPDGAGRLVLGRGLEGRWEAAIGVSEAARGRGVGRGLAAAARRLVGPGDVVFAQIAPGNVASVRAALAAGFTPVAAEILFQA